MFYIYVYSLWDFCMYFIKNLDYSCIRPFYIALHWRNTCGWMIYIEKSLILTRISTNCRSMAQTYAWHLVRHQEAYDHGRRRRKRRRITWWEGEVPNTFKRLDLLVTYYYDPHSHSHLWGIPPHDPKTSH